jgi:hypothetical protein
MAENTNSPDAIEELRARVDILEAVENARRVVMEYAHAIDGGHEAMLEQVYSPDAVLTRLGVMDDGAKHGWPQIRDALNRATGFAPNQGRHVIGTTTCTAASTTEVTFLSNFIAFREEEGRMLVFWGDYEDTVRKEDGKWRLARKLTTSNHRLSFPMPSATVDY